MVIKATVLDDVSNSYTGKNGFRQYQELILLDEDKESRMHKTLSYNMSDQEKAQYAGKLKDKTVRIGITDIESFNGMPRLKGKILEVVGGLK